MSNFRYSILHLCVGGGGGTPLKKQNLRGTRSKNGYKMGINIQKGKSVKNQFKLVEKSKIRENVYQKVVGLP